MSSPPSPQAHPSPPPMTSSPSDLVPFMAIVGGLAAVVLVATAVYCFVVHSQGTRKMTDIRAKAEEWSTSTQEVELSSAMDMELNDAALEAQMAADNESPAGSKFVGGVRRPTI